MLTEASLSKLDLVTLPFFKDKISVVKCSYQLFSLLIHHLQTAAEMVVIMEINETVVDSEGVCLIRQ